LLRESKALRYPSLDAAVADLSQVKAILEAASGAWSGTGGDLRERARGFGLAGTARGLLHH
jgi:hypothetical protein